MSYYVIQCEGCARVTPIEVWGRLASRNCPDCGARPDRHRVVSEETALERRANWKREMQQRLDDEDSVTHRPRLRAAGEEG